MGLKGSTEFLCYVMGKARNSIYFDNVSPIQIEHTGRVTLLTQAIYVSKCSVRCKDDLSNVSTYFVAHELGIMGRKKIVDLIRKVFPYPPSMTKFSPM